MEYLDFEKFVGQATGYLKSRIKKAEAEFGIGALPRYEYDLHRGEIWWSEVGDPKVRGRVTVVGSTSTVTHTWFWSWANPHFDDVPIGEIERVREFGEKEGIAKLTEAKWAAEEVDGWEMTSVSARLLEAAGAYRSPSEKGFLFLLYDHLEIIPENEREPYMPLKRANKTVEPNSGDAPRNPGGAAPS